MSISEDLRVFTSGVLFLREESLEVANRMGSQEVEYVRYEALYQDVVFGRLINVCAS